MITLRHFVKRVRVPKKFNPKISAIFGRIALELGDRAEKYVEEVFDKAESEDKLPSWLLGWERKKKYSTMDKKGVDFMFHTVDVGPIFINIKSSQMNALRFEREHPDGGIRAVVVNILDPPMTTYGKVIGAVARQRDKFLSLRAAPA
ncbi:MAG: hypothetical protein KGJ90_00875 [Patescibacteria group bacterium]|nr:hypothetical protein [Patescibacteria group bacterium]MDE2232672.1 hypothetical protein [Patescibacteria group bacterium]